MAVLDIQRKGQQIGRIRIGQQVPVMRDGRDTGNTRPARLSTFRFTTASRHTADAIAELFGGVVREWNAQLEVITTRSEISVMVPPRDAVVSQWYEMWNAGGALRRCDSQFDQISRGPCQCPHAEDPGNADEVNTAALKRAELAKGDKPTACHLITRVSVMIPDLPGLGVFRLDTGSFYAAAEIGDTAAILQAARDKGVFLPAVLRIEQRQRIAGGQTKKYPVPVLEIMSTFRQIASGELAAGGMAAQLPPAPGEKRRALTAAPAAPQAPAPDPSMRDDREPMTAEQIADLAAKTRGRDDVEFLVGKAEADRVEHDLVNIDPDGPGRYVELREYLTAVWRVGPEKALEALA